MWVIIDKGKARLIQTVKLDELSTFILKHGGGSRYKGTINLPLFHYFDIHEANDGTLYGYKHG